MHQPLYNRTIVASIIGIGILSMVLLVEPQNSLKTYNGYTTLHLPLFSGAPLQNEKTSFQEDRQLWSLKRVADPATGEIPQGMRRRELAYAKKLQEQFKSKTSTEYNWIAMGPYNVGGRTRALAIDVSNENVLLAGGVSGGLWRSTDGGNSWAKVTTPLQHHSITTIAQDTRAGKTSTWYYGGGESIGNSASKSFQATYTGTGIFKSSDGGLTWDTISSTVSGTPQTVDIWDFIWRIAVDPSVDSLDIVFAATDKMIYKSNDGGMTWAPSLNAGGFGTVFTDIAITSTGVAYATLGSTASNNGIWRSGDHGVSWTNIGNSSGWPPSDYRRIVMAIDPSNENKVYFLGNTPNYGKLSNVFFGGKDWNSLWRYTYLNGDGADSNGIWVDLTENIPAYGPSFDNFNSQGSYNLVIAVKPDDSNTVFIGGTNLYRSTTGFTDSINTTLIGGYMESTTLPYFELYPNHHPDNHKILFLPSDNNVLISGNDGGVFKTTNCTSSSVVWSSLDRGYHTSQFYTIGIDHGPANNNIIFGGLQDNGTWWTNSLDPLTPWAMPSTGDGSFCAVSDGGQYYYFSRQKGKMLKTTLDGNGVPTAFNRIDPIGGGGYQFINPFILDPMDNDVMYLSGGATLWRNDSLADIPLTNEYDSISTGWLKLTNAAPASSSITALACSKSPAHRLYYGTASRQVFRMDSANIGNPPSVEITNNISVSGGSYVSCIAIDPRDADKVIVVYCNYITYSLFYTTDGGNYWMKVAGNLETGPPAGTLPSQYDLLKHIGDGPSCRWASIIPIGGDSTLYLLGTSVGLFTTNTLVDDSTTNDSTVWIPQAANTVGNVVVDMIDYRESDGFVVIGTHGTGVYRTYVLEDTTGIHEVKNTDVKIASLQAHPNPTVDKVTFTFEIGYRSEVTLIIYNKGGKQVGKLINQNMAAGSQTIDYDTGPLSQGMYFYTLSTGSNFLSGKLIKL